MAITNGKSLKDTFGYLFADLAKLVTAESVITEANVLQKSNKPILNIIEGMVEQCILPGSRLEGMENLSAFLDKIKEGKKGIILMEHYSNFDFPALVYLLLNTGGEVGKEIANRLVAMAGMKLNEENPMVKAWASAFDRIVIYPSRSLASITDPVEREAEEKRSRAINMASMRALDRVRKDGHVILVFPSGTRYRPGKPETKRGVREIDSYLRLSDVMILVSINGNCLRISESDPSNMLADEVHQDKVICGISPVYECKNFRNEVLDTVPEDIEDKKQCVVDKVMEILEVQHDKYEVGRLD